MKSKLLSAVTLTVAVAVALTASSMRAEPDARATVPQAVELSKHATDIDRGRYLARIAGCNDCHTPGYAQSGGKVPESMWLIGDALGWRGPWGTTYAANLRLRMQDWSEEEWLTVAKNAQFRPPMPWFALRDMEVSDLRALYRFIRSLGTAGSPAPAYLPPGVEARGPVVQFPVPPEVAQKLPVRQ
jgi:mono/diheme cytochrome c family protein